MSDDPLSEKAKALDGLENNADVDTFLASDDIEQSLQDEAADPILSEDDIERMLAEELLNPAQIQGDGSKIRQRETPGEGEIYAEEDDIDALLSGFSFEDQEDELDEGDIFEDISESKMAELQNKFKTLEENAALQAKLNEDMSFREAKSDIDDKIKEALQNDQTDQLDALINSGESNFFEDVSIYDVEDRSKVLKMSAQDKINEALGAEGKWWSKIWQKVKLMPPVRLYIITGVMAMFVLFLGGFAISMIVLSIPSQNYMPIAQPTYTGNDSVFIFVEQTETLGTKDLTMVKLLMDPETTDFYLDGPLDVYDYNITMVDENDKVYMLNLDSLPSRTQSQEAKKTVIHMEPLDAGVEKFALHVVNPQSGESTMFGYEFQHPMVPMPAKYVNQTLGAGNAGNQATIVVENSVFASGRSRINFKLKSSNSKEQFTFMPSEDTPNVVLAEGGRGLLTVPPLILYNFENTDTVFGQANFVPVKDLNKDVAVTFENLFQLYETNLTMPALSLMNNGVPYQKVVPLSNYNVFIERFLRGGNKFVLVLHGEKQGEVVPAAAMEQQTDLPLEIDNRVETKPIVELVATTESGKTITLQGTVRSGQVGTDVVFDGTEYAEELQKVPLENITLHMSKVAIQNPPTAIDISLKNMPEIRGANQLHYRKAILDSFHSRLSYKSGEIDKAQIAGFASNVLQDKKLMSHYEPSTTTTQPIYSAQIISSFYEYDSLEAIVKEIWQGSPDDLATDFYLTHHITAKPTKNAWVIVSDEVEVTQVDEEKKTSEPTKQ